MMQSKVIVPLSLTNINCLLQIAQHFACGERYTHIYICLHKEGDTSGLPTRGTNRARTVWLWFWCNIACHFWHRSPFSLKLCLRGTGVDQSGHPIQTHAIDRKRAQSRCCLGCDLLRQTFHFTCKKIGFDPIWPPYLHGSPSCSISSSVDTLCRGFPEGDSEALETNRSMSSETSRTTLGEFMSILINFSDVGMISHRFLPVLRCFSKHPCYVLN